MRFKRIIILLVASILLLELTSRLAMTIVFHIPFFQLDKISHRFYPELEMLEQYDYDDKKINLLVLAGSVLDPDTVIVEIGGDEIDVHFCALEKALDPTRYNVVNLARSGHNSLDSWYKYQTIKERFDYVFVYHGINDTRVNNIARADYDKNYRHIEFYDDLYTINRHPEFQYFSLPLSVDWLIHSIRKKNKFYIPKEMFPGLISGQPEPYVLEGSDIKSGEAFGKNIKKICDRAIKEYAKPVLAAYAYYLPLKYSRDSFNLKTLDYAQQIFPPELYGLPDNVLEGLKIHETVIENLAKKEGILWVDINGQIPKSQVYFDDICHLTDAGCAIVARELDLAITH